MAMGMDYGYRYGYGYTEDLNIKEKNGGLALKDKPGIELIN